MTAPTAKVRGLTFLRDRNRCVAASDACYGRLEWNHREASGHGGRGKKAGAVTPADGVILCSSHNARLESDADFRRKGLSLGWKLSRYRGGLSSDEIPFYDVNEREWFLPDVEGNRRRIIPAVALELVEAAGGSPKLMGGGGPRNVVQDR